MSLASLIDSRWFTDISTSSAWFAGFRAFRFEGLELNSAQTVEVLGVRAILLNGAVSYLALDGIKMEVLEENVRFSSPKPQSKSEPPGPHLILVTAHKVDGSVAIEAHSKDRIAKALGLLTAFCGRNVGFEKLFECEISVDGTKVSLSSDVYVNPFTFPKVVVSHDLLQTLHQVSSFISALPSGPKSRVVLSLKWFHDAIFDPDQIMSFLKLWIAIETLAMPDATNVQPVNAILAQVYGMGIEDAAKKFFVGRIQGLRSDIVHDGKIVAIHSGLTDYLQSLYFDLLSSITCLISERRLEHALNNPSFSIESFLRQSTAQ